MAEASVKVFNLIKSIPSRIFGNDPNKISEYYEIPEALAHYLLQGVENGDIDLMLARGDFVMSADGLKCLEYNVNTNLGGLQMAFWESLYLNTPVIVDFLQCSRIRIASENIFSILFKQLVDAILKKTQDDRGEINIVVAVPGSSGIPSEKVMEQYFNSVYEELLKNQYDGLEGKIIICDYNRLKVAGGTVRCHGKVIHAIIEWYLGYVPDDILEVWRENRLTVLNGPLTWILSTKSNLALLSELEDSEIFTPAERDIIKKHVPWTRAVNRGDNTYRSRKIRLEDFVLAEREKLVLKPMLGSGGNDIYIGRYCSQEKWRTIVDASLRGEHWRDLTIMTPVTLENWQALTEKALEVKRFVVQEYVESESYLYQWGEYGCTAHSAIWGYFLCGKEYGGSWVRVLPREHERGIINCHQGARVSVVFGVDE